MHMALRRRSFYSCLFSVLTRLELSELSFCVFKRNELHSQINWDVAVAVAVAVAIALLGHCSCCWHLLLLFIFSAIYAHRQTHKHNTCILWKALTFNYIWRVFTVYLLLFFSRSAKLYFVRCVGVAVAAPIAVAVLFINALSLQLRKTGFQKQQQQQQRYSIALKVNRRIKSE